MNILRTYATIGVLLICFQPAKAQEHYGRVGSNYSPTTSVWFNPALVSDSRAFIDLHLVGASAFFHNNYAYLEGGSLTRANLQSGQAEPLFNTSRKRIHAHADARVLGPAVTFPIRKMFVGFTTSARTFASVRGVDAELANLAIDGLQQPDFFNQTFALNRTRINALATFEVGAVAAGIIQQRGNDIHSGGVHLRRVWPLAGASLLMHDARFSVIDSSEFVLENLRAEFAFSDFDALANNPGFRFAGGGWGIDLGWSWKRARRAPSGYAPFDPSSGCEWCDYRWKFSLALLDLGWVSFDPPYFLGEGASSDEASWQDYADWNPETADEVQQTFEDEFGVQTRGDRKYRMMLPTALSAQYDYHAYGRFYVSGNAVIGVPWVRTKGIQRASSMAVVPRLETRFFEMSMPVSIAAMQRPVWGLMFRFHSVIIGSDNLGPLLFRGDAYGSDFYIHIKASLFKNPKCGNANVRSRHPKTGRKGHVACPDW